MRPVPRVLRLLRQGVSVSRAAGSAPGKAPPAAAVAGSPPSAPPSLMFSTALAAEESCAATAHAVVARAFSTTPPPSDDSSDDEEAPAAAAAPHRPQRASSTIIAQDGPNVYRVSRSTVPRVLATKIASEISDPDNGEIVLSAVGAQALFTAARALAVANEDLAAAGKPPVLVTEIRNMGARNAKALVARIADPSLGITHATALEFDEERRFALRKVQDRSITPVAGALKAAVMMGHKPIMVSGVGAIATSNLVFACFLATTWAREEGVESVILPGRQLVEGGGDNGTTLGVIKFFVIRTSAAVVPPERRQPSSDDHDRVDA